MGEVVGAKVGAKVGVAVGEDVGVLVGAKVGEEVGASVGHSGTVIVSASVLIVPPKAKALPSIQLTLLPIVIPESSITVPAKTVFAPMVVAAAGNHQI